MKLAISLATVLTTLMLLPAGADYLRRPLPNEITQEEFPLGWQNYDKGVAQAKAYKKHVLIQFFDQSCRSCQLMGSDVTADPSLDDTVRQNFVLVRVNQASKRSLHYRGKSISEQEFTKKHQVKAYPTLMFLSPSGQPIGRTTGYLKPQDLNDLLNYVASKAYEKMEYQAYRGRSLGQRGS